MQTAIIISASAFGLLFLGSVIVLFRRLTLLSRLGKRERGFPRKSKRQFIGVLLCSPLLIALGLWKDYNAITMTALSCTAILAFIVSLSDILFIGIGGLYERGFVWNSTVILFSRIKTFAQKDPYTMEIRTAWRTRKTFVFTDTNLVQSLRVKLEKNQEHLQ